MSHDVLRSLLKFGYSEMATKFERIFHLKFDVTQWRQILSGRFFQILWSSQNIRTLPNKLARQKLFGWDFSHLVLS